MESIQITTVAELVDAVRRREVLVLPISLNTVVAEAKRIDQLLQAARDQGYKLVRYADPALPGRPIDLAAADATELQSAAIGIRFD